MATVQEILARVTAEDLAGDIVRQEDPLFGVVWINPARLSGVPCFFGTRVPVKNLFDALRAGQTIAEFLDDFPGVDPTQVARILERASTLVTDRGTAA